MEARDLALGGQGELGPAGRQRLEHRGRGRVVEPAVGGHPPQRVAGAGREVHRVHRDRAEGDGRRPFRLRHGPPGLAEQPRHDPEAHRRLVAEPARGVGARQMAAERAERLDLVLVRPEVVQRLVVGLERRPERVGRQREERLGLGQPVPGPHRGVGEDRGGVGAAVHQRHALAFLEVEVPDPAREVQHRQHLARAGLAAEGHAGQGPAQQGRHPLGELGADLSVTFDEVHQPGEDHAPDYLLGVASAAEAVSRLGAEQPRVLTLLLRRHRRRDLDPRAGGDAVDERGPVGVEQGEEPAPGGGHGVPRQRADLHVLPPERGPAEAVQREIGPPVHHDGHQRLPGGRAGEAGAVSVRPSPRSTRRTAPAPSDRCR